MYNFLGEKVRNFFIKTKMISSDLNYSKTLDVKCVTLILTKLITTN